MRATPEFKAKLERTVKALGFKSMAHFFTRSAETLLEQVDMGQSLIWPLRYEQRKRGRPPTVKLTPEPQMPQKRREK